MQTEVLKAQTLPMIKSKVIEMNNWIQIKRKIDTIIEVVNDLSDEVYGADIENENNEGYGDDIVIENE